MRRLSELEGVCLGLIHRYQPCTSYRVRRELRRAPSSHWQASAGSVYPLIARLEAEALVIAATDTADGRGRKLLRVTARGRRALRGWVLAGADPALIASVTDPIRSRTFFLDVLAAPRRSEYLESLIMLMEGHLSEAKAHLEGMSEQEDLCGYLGSWGALRLTEARLDWLRLVRRRLQDDQV